MTRLLPEDSRRAETRRVVGFARSRLEGKVPEGGVKRKPVTSYILKKNGVVSFTNIRGRLTGTKCAGETVEGGK